jgi:hypothetical protein
MSIVQLGSCEHANPKFSRSYFAGEDEAMLACWVDELVPRFR